MTEYTKDSFLHLFCDDINIEDTGVRRMCTHHWCCVSCHVRLRAGLIPHVDVATHVSARFYIRACSAPAGGLLSTRALLRARSDSATTNRTIPTYPIAKVCGSAAVRNTQL